MWWAIFLTPLHPNSLNLFSQLIRNKNENVISLVFIHFGHFGVEKHQNQHITNQYDMLMMSKLPANDCLKQKNCWMFVLSAPTFEKTILAFIWIEAELPSAVRDSVCLPFSLRQVVYSRFIGCPKRSIGTTICHFSRSGSLNQNKTKLQRQIFWRNKHNHTHRILLWFKRELTD